MQIPPDIEKFPAAKQERMDELLDKNGEGKISPVERSELEQLVEDAEKLMVENARRLASFAEGEAPRPSQGGVPVTVWVSSEPVHG